MLDKNELLREISLASRRLSGKPRLVIAVVCTLSLGVAANATVYRLLDRLLLSPPPHVTEPSAIVRLGFVHSLRDGQQFVSSIVPFPYYSTLAADPRLSHTIAGFSHSTIRYGNDPAGETIKAGIVTGSFFRVLGTPALLGRTIGDSAESSVVVLGHSFWRERFQSREQTIGATITLGDRDYTVIGIVPRGFSGIESDRVDVWLSVGDVAPTLAGTDWRTNFGWSFLQIIARVPTGVSSEQFASWVGTRLQGGRDLSAPSLTVTKALVHPIWPKSEFGKRREVLVAVILGVTSFLVLAVAIFNVTNLLLADSLRRRKEFALRFALGMARSRFVRLQLAETLLLSALTAVVGLLLSYLLGSFVQLRLLSNLEWPSGSASASVFLFTMIAALAASIVSAIGPAVQLARLDPAFDLREGARPRGSARAALRRTLTITQGAVAVILIVIAGLFIKSLHNIRTVEIGIRDPETLIVVSSSADRMGYEPVVIDRRFRELKERLLRMPYVESASLTTQIPLQSSFATHVEIEGTDPPPHLPTGGPYVNAIDEDALRTLGARVAAGRGFTATDQTAGAEQVVLVNQSMVRFAWRGVSPLGACLKTTRDVACRRVVGVVEDIVREDVVEAPTMQLYVPLEQRPVMMTWRVLLLRVTESPHMILSEVEREIQTGPSRLPGMHLDVLQEMIDPATRTWRLAASLFGLFGGLALTIAAIGLYSSVALRVEERKQELGIRLALGAPRATTVRFVASQGMTDALLGCGIGTVLAVGLSPQLLPVLTRVSPHDLSVFAAALILSCLAAVCATILPLFSALRSAPSHFLRLSQS